MAEKFVRARPSQSGNLHDFGRALPYFLSDFEATVNLPYLPDVARLEWAYHTVYHAADPRPFTNEMLSQFSARELPDIRFELGPACRLVQSPYPIFRIWQANQESCIDDEAICLDTGPESVMIIRTGQVVELWLLSDPEAALLAAIDSGNLIGPAVDAVSAHDQPCGLSTVLARYLLSGAIIVCNDQASTANLHHMLPKSLSA